METAETLEISPNRTRQNLNMEPQYTDDNHNESMILLRR